MKSQEVDDSQQYYQKMTAQCQSRLLPGEDAIWGAMPFDPTSEYQQIETTSLSALYDIPPKSMGWFFGRILASYDKDKHDQGQAKLTETIEVFKETVGPQIRDICKEGRRLLVNVDHQSRFSPLIASLLLQHATAETPAALMAMRSISSSIYSRYLGFYELKVGKILGDPTVPSRPALDVARNVCGLIPVFPNTDIRDSCGIDPALQHDINKKVMQAARPTPGKAHIRTFVASAALDAKAKDGSLRMRTVSDSTKQSAALDDWDYTMAIATHIDKDPERSFFVASGVEEGIGPQTLDRQNAWMAQVRSQRTGLAVQYEAAT